MENIEYNQWYNVSSWAEANNGKDEVQWVGMGRPEKAWYSTFQLNKFRADVVGWWANVFIRELECNEDEGITEMEHKHLNASVCAKRAYMHDILMYIHK